MNAKVLVVIGLIACSAAVYGADSDYDFQKDMDRCTDQADSLTSGSSNNGGDCQLYQGLKNISTQVQVNLTATQQTTLTTFIENCKTSVFAVSTYSDEEKFIQFAALLSRFSEENAAIYGIIQYQNISTWSSVNTVEKVTITKQQTRIQSTLTIDDNDDCPFFDGLIAAAQSTSDQNIINAVNTMISEHLVEIVQNESLTFEEKTIQIQVQCQQLFATYSSFETVVQYTQISGFGIFGQFFNCATTYKQVESKDSICTGTFPDIPLIKYLQDALAIYKKQDIKIALTFNQFIQRVNQSFTQITDVHERQVWFANYVLQWETLNYSFTTKYIFSISFGIDFGSCWDFCYCVGAPGPVITSPPTKASDATEGYTSASSFYTELPSSSSSCGCVCE